VIEKSRWMRLFGGLADFTVRPGITGWAQINGGSLITKEEKGALDDWYIRHASLWLDAPPSKRCFCTAPACWTKG
jgi:lipopolysaccharide/colanic/teichoic acid biosynthesis glycosyltransferase